MKRAGFTLIELMVVITVIAIIAAIALPALLRSRLQTNETAAIQNLRTVLAAQTSFHSANNRFGTIAELAEDAAGTGVGHLDSTWTEGVQRQGYAFSMAQATVGFFLCYADPIEHEITGIRFFRIDPSGIVRWNAANRPADTDPEIGAPGT